MPNTYNTLGSLFTAIANSIRAKDGTSASIVADNFPARIDAIQTGITPRGSITITANGTYDVTDKASAVVNVKESLLPSTYQEVEYISASNSNGAYIDLGIGFNGKARSEITFQSQGGNADLQIFGASENGGVHRYMLSCGYTGISDAFYFSTGTAFTATYTSTMPIGTKCTILATYNQSLSHWINSANITNGAVQFISQTSSYTTYTITSHLYLLGQNYNGNYRGKGLKIVYRFKHWDENDALVRDMIPCYRKSDSVIGMYDLVNDVFYTNAGTGSFTKGADV